MLMMDGADAIQLLARLCSGERVTFVELCRETSALRPVSAPTAAKEVVQAAHHTSHSYVPVASGTHHPSPSFIDSLLWTR